jgi:hypothetical protein
LIGLIYLLVLYGYFLIARAVYRAIKPQSKRKAHYWAGFTVALPAWYLFGYLLSSSYREFSSLCDADTKAQIVQPVPTNIPYTRFCTNMLIAKLASSAYEAIDCEERGQIFRYEHVGDSLPKCQQEQTQSEFLQVCIQRTPISRAATPNAWVHGKIVESKKSLFFVGRLEVLETRNTLPDGTVVAFLRNYRYFPQGSAIWLGGSSGAAPIIQCERRTRFPSLEQMFPPDETKDRL